MKTYQAQPLDLMQYINRTSREPHISVRITLKEVINVERLIYSVDELLNRFPILKCGYEPDKNLFVEISDFSSKQVIVGDTAENVMPERYLESLDIRKQLIRIAVSGKNLYITVSHMVCDGSSFKSLVYILCDIYNGKSVPATETLMKRDFTEYFTETVTPEKKAEMLATIYSGYENPQLLCLDDSEALHIAEYQLEKDTMTSIHNRAKKEGATLNDVFLATYAKVIHQISGAVNLEIPVTSDLRKHTQGAEGICNLTGNYNLYLKVQEEPFSQTLHSVSVKMQKLKAGQNDIIGPGLLVERYKNAELSYFIAKYEKMGTAPYVSFTNLGILDDERLSFGDNEVTDANIYSVVQKTPYFQMAVSSFRGSTTVSCLVRGGDGTAESVRTMIKALVEHLETFV